MNDLVVRSQATAARFLDTPQLADRWAHVRAVGARVAEIADAAGIASPERELIAAAGVLHDVGYAPDLAVTGFHPLDGARFLQGSAFPARLVALVAHHSGARFEAAERGLLAELETFPLEDETAMDILVAADLTTGPRGQRLTFQERFDDILVRYPPDSVVHRAMTRAQPVLAAHLERLGLPITR
jgi:hypothetical protein